MSQLQDLSDKIVSIEYATAKVAEWKAAGHVVVLTNGCFDILHQGHVVYLAKSRDLGDKLVVGLNTDGSVKRLGKGDGRPVNSETARAMTLAGLSSVDLIVHFDEDTPIELIRQLGPDVLAKGADYDPDLTNENDPKYIVGSNEVRAAGGRVAAIELEEGFSTTSIIERLSNG